MYAIETKSGTQLWRTRTGDDVRAGATINAYGHQVVIGSNDQSVYALELDGGKELWAVETEDVVEGSAGSDGRIPD